MKKSLLLLWLVIVGMHAFSQINSPAIDAFLNSREYSRIKNSTIADFGTVDLVHSTVLTVSNDAPPVVNIILAKDGVFEGVVQAIQLPGRYRNVLPGDEHYLMVLYDYSAYDTLNKTGHIKIVDLNYDDWVPVEMTVTSGVMSDLATQFMPAAISKKYSYLLKKRDLGNPIYNEQVADDAAAGKHHCDQNGNGNVTFGECFSCYTSACAGSSQCAILCAIINSAGLWVMANMACTNSIVVSCAWISFWW